MLYRVNSRLGLQLYLAQHRTWSQSNDRSLKHTHTNTQKKETKKKFVDILSTSIFPTSSPLIYCLLLIVSENGLCSEMLSLSDKNNNFDTLGVPAVTLKTIVRSPPT